MGVVRERVERVVGGAGGIEPVDQHGRGAGGPIAVQRHQVVGAGMVRREALERAPPELHERIGRQALGAGAAQVAVVGLDLVGEAAPRGRPVLGVERRGPAHDRVHDRLAIRERLQLHRASLFRARL